MVDQTCPGCGRSYGISLSWCPECGRRGRNLTTLARQALDRGEIEDHRAIVTEVARRERRYQEILERPTKIRGWRDIAVMVAAVAYFGGMILGMVWILWELFAS